MEEFKAIPKLWDISRLFKGLHRMYLRKHLKTYQGYGIPKDYIENSEGLFRKYPKRHLGAY
jgi:hypothetical protein